MYMYTSIFYEEIKGLFRVTPEEVRARLSLLKSRKAMCMHVCVIISEK